MSSAEDRAWQQVALWMAVNSDGADFERQYLTNVFGCYPPLLTPAEDWDALTLCQFVDLWLADSVRKRFGHES